MKTKMNYSLDSEVVEELRIIADKMGTKQSKLLNKALKNAFEEIKKLNYNYSEFMRERV